MLYAVDLSKTMAGTNPRGARRKTTGSTSRHLSRRGALVAGAGLISGLAGCSDNESASNTENEEESSEASSQQESEQDDGSSDESEQDHGSSNESEDEATDTNATEEPSTDHNETDTPEESEADTTATLVIDYEGEWSGTLETGGSSQSIDGHGSETFEIEGENSSIMVSATIMKEDSSSETLLVEMIVDDQVVQSSSTNSPSGTVTLSYQQNVS